MDVGEIDSLRSIGPKCLMDRYAFSFIDKLENTFLPCYPLYPVLWVLSPKSENGTRYKELLFPGCLAERGHQSLGGNHYGLLSNPHT